MRLSRLRTRAMIGLLCLSAAILPARPAQALDRNVRAVFVTSAYGAIGGTVLGLAILPFSKNVRSVFIGTSVGLYLGIAVGLYYVFDRDNPNNPLHVEGLGPDQNRNDRYKMDPLLAGQQLRWIASERSPGQIETAAEQAAPTAVDIPVLRF